MKRFPHHRAIVGAVTGVPVAGWITAVNQFGFWASFAVGFVCAIAFIGIAVGSER